MNFKRNCPNCGTEKQYKSVIGYNRAVKNNSCCQRCANNWERVFGKENAKKMKERYKHNNAGKKLPKDTIEKIRNSIKEHWAKFGYPSSAIEKLKARISKPMSEETKHKLKQYSGKNSSAVRKILKEKNITYNEYLETIPLWVQYRRRVDYITSQQPIHLLDHYEKRGKAIENDNAYHLDHIISVKYGFDNNIDPAVIGDISNLRFIHWRENLSKSSKLIL